MAGLSEARFGFVAESGKAFGKIAHKEQGKARIGHGISPNFGSGKKHAAIVCRFSATRNGVAA
jgi:hypothetical protein